MSTFRIRELRPFAVALVMVAGFYALPALAALDATGTWTGTWKCKDVTKGAATKPGGSVTMTITQSGGNVNASVDRGTRKDTFQGQIQELTAKPGQAATTLIACGTTAGTGLYGETLSANVKASSSAATFKGASAYESADVPTVGGTCKYSLKRTATADPGIAPCVVPSACGNGTIEAGEQCDVGNLNGQTCAMLKGFTGGTLACGPGCRFDTSGCSVAPVCGDGTIEAGEQCDAGNLNGETCVTLKFDGGTLACGPGCTFDTSGCYVTLPAVCGNGTIDAGEQCDGGNLNGETCVTLKFAGGTLACGPGCTFDTSGCSVTPPPVCGNGTVETGEQCDAGDLNGQTCAALGFAGGTLSCGPGCTFDTSACVIPTCLFTGEACSVGTDCCSGACSAGTCISCFSTGESCFTDADCCSATCTAHVCG